MPQSISNRTNSDRWNLASDVNKTRPLRLIKSRPGTPVTAEVRGSSPSQILSTSAAYIPPQSAIQRSTQNTTPSSLFDADDPAFSNDPYQHPDHHDPSTSQDVKADAYKNGPSLVWHARFDEEEEEEPPPTYDESVPVSPEQGHFPRPQSQEEATSSLASDSREEVRGSGHLRETAQASYTPTSTPFSSSSHLPESQQGVQDYVAEQEELLSYLNEDFDVSDTVPDRNIPMSLRPHRGLPMMTQRPSDSQDHARPGRPDRPDTAGLLRSATLPPTAMRTISEPLVRTNTERPQVPRRGNTATPRRVPADLDRIDELDETTPLGVHLHNRGPYEVRGKVNTPPPRVVPLQVDRRQQRPPRQHVLVAATPSNAPPPPVPFKLNLRPGEVLTRVPPQRSQTTPPELYPSSATGSYPLVSAEQPVYQRPRRTAQNQADSRHDYRDNNRTEWSPEQLYEMPSHLSPPILSRDVSLHPYPRDARNDSPSSSASTSRSDVRPNMGLYSDPRLQPERLAPQNRVSFQQLPQQSALSRSISQPQYPPSSFSSSQSSLSRPPPSAADRHRPKRIVLPAPLQPQNLNSTYTPPSELYRKAGQNGMSAAQPPQPAAAVIPVHDPKKGNLLKKRATTGSALHQSHKHLAPERAPSTKNFFGLGGGFGRSLTPEPVLDFPKASRKLSKRGKI